MLPCRQDVYTHLRTHSTYGKNADSQNENLTQTHAPTLSHKFHKRLTPLHLGQALEERFSEEISLHQVYAALPQGVALFRGFHGFTNDLDVERRAEFSHGTHDRLRPGPLVEIPNQLRIELDDVRLQFGEEVQAAVTRAEIIQSNSEAVFFVLGNDALQMRRIADWLMFRDLEDDPIKREMVQFRSTKGLCDTGCRAVDGFRHEVYRQTCSGFDHAQSGSQSNRLHAAYLIEGVAVFSSHLGEDRKCRLVLRTSNQGLIFPDGACFDIDNGLKGHGEGKWFFDSISAGPTAGARL